MPAAPEEENVWTKIIDEIQSKSSSTFPQAAVLVLGENDAGKTTLVAQLRRDEDLKRGSGMEYHYLDVNPDYKDGSYAYQLGSALPDIAPGESVRLGVWVLDGDPAYSKLIRFPLQAAPLERCVVLLCASMTEPWAILDSLQRWTRILDDHLQQTNDLFDAQALREAQERQVRFWQEYVEPLDSSSHSETGAKVPSMETDASSILLPLGETTLTHNLGLPIIVVITKCDVTSTLDKEYDLKDEHLDFMQSNIRRFCLNYGAALVYTSVKENRNCELLYKYILHRTYGFPFTQPVLVVDRDAVFIPAGWDNEKKIGILDENLTNIKTNDSFKDVIQRPTFRRPVGKDQEIYSEDEQIFLVKLQTALQKEAPTAATPAAPVRQDSGRGPNLATTATPSVKTPQVVGSSSSPAVNKSQKTEAANRATPNATQEATLANFFNQLLTKKAGPGTSPNIQQRNNDKNDVQKDAAVELERMLNESKKQSKQPSAAGDESPAKQASIDGEQHASPTTNGDQGD